MDLKIQKYGSYISEYARENYRECLREPNGLLKFKFIVPGNCYPDELLDWDLWLTASALRGIAEKDSFYEYEKGCILNFLEYVDDEGRMPIFINLRKTALTAFGEGEKNIHKPCLVHHALSVSQYVKNAECYSNS